VALNPRWQESRGTQPANAFVGTVAKDDAKWILCKLPAIVSAGLQVAKAHLDYVGGNFGTAAERIGIKALEAFLAPDKIAEEQGLFVKFIYTSILRDGDGRKRPQAKILEELAHVTKELVAVGGGCFSASTVMDLECLSAVLTPEAASSETLASSINHVKQSESLKAFRVYDVGSRLIMTATSAGEKVAACKPRVDEFKAWLGDVKRIASPAVDPPLSPKYFSEVSQCAITCGALLQAMRGDETLAKSIAATTNHQLPDMCLSSDQRSRGEMEAISLVLLGVVVCKRFAQHPLSAAFRMVKNAFKSVSSSSARLSSCLLRNVIVHRPALRPRLDTDPKLHRAFALGLVGRLSNPFARGKGANNGQ